MVNFSPSSEHPSSDYADDEDENEDEQEVTSEGKEEQVKKDLPLWTVVCSTEEEWRQLAESFKKSKHKDEKMLYETLSVDFVPEIGKMIEAKVWLLACSYFHKSHVHNLTTLSVGILNEMFEKAGFVPKDKAITEKGSFKC